MNAETITLKLKGVPEKHDRCSYCAARTNLKEFPVDERYNTFMRDGIFIPKRSKLCPDHIDNRNWDSKAETFWNHKYSASKIDEIFHFVRCKYLSNCKNQLIREPQIRLPEINRNEIALDENQLSTLLELLPSLSFLTRSREKAKKCLQLYLMRLRKNMSQEDLGKYFQISSITAARLIKIARNSLTSDLVEKFFGFKNITRTVLQQHTTQQSRILFCDAKEESVITIWDGKYIFCVKSGNLRFQRDTYSVQKKRNLVKPMVCVSPDGFIVDIFCPFTASENDASILQKILRENQEVKNVLQPSDIFVVDRGFRDSSKTLERLGFVVKIPSCVTEAGGQLTNKQANDSRLVTKLRWVVEARNGHLKTIWPFFAKQWSTYELVHLNEDIRVAAALINMFFESLIPDKADGENIVQKMMEKASEEKPLFHALIQRQTSQKQIRHFIEIDLEHFDFPVIDERDLKNISLGTYQIKQAVRYSIQHTKSFTDIFECFECPHDVLQSNFQAVIKKHNISTPVLVLVRLSSRFRNRTSYHTFVLADKDKVGVDAICSYHCNCVNGQRSVGCCAHVMCVLRFLCHARHTGDVRCIAPYLDEYFDHK